MGWSLLNDTEHIVFTHDQVLFTFNFNFRARVFSEQNPVANLDFQRHTISIVADFTVSNRNDLSLGRVFLWLYPG